MKRKTKKAPEIRPSVAVVRNDKGQVVEGGGSLNPGGRSRSEKDVVEAARQHGVAVIDKLAKMFFEDGNLFAGIEILNRAYGKAKTKVELTGEDGAPIRVSAVREVLAARFAKLLAGGDGK